MKAMYTSQIKYFALLATMLIGPFAAFAGGNAEGGSSLRLSMGGSTTVEPIITSAMEVYREEVDPSAELSYDAPGSTAGIKAGQSPQT